MAMKKRTDEEKAALEAAIRTHIMEVGPQKWELLQQAFPDISRSTLFRAIDKVRLQVESVAASQGAGPLKVAQRRIRTRVEPLDKVDRRIKAQLPTSPSPAVVSGLGQVADDIFDFMAYFKKIVGDADLIRESMLTKADDGSVKVKNPVLLDRNISRRLDIIEAWLHSQQLLFNLERIQELYRVVVEEVGLADPDTQRAILSRLRQLNAQRGLTVGMGA